MADEVSKTGVFIDVRTGKVVESEPEEGIQLVPPGGIVTPEADAQIKAARTASSPAKGGVVDLSVTEPSNAAPTTAPTAKDASPTATKGRR